MADKRVASLAVMMVVNLVPATVGKSVTIKQLFYSKINILKNGENKTNDIKIIAYIRCQQTNPFLGLMCMHLSFDLLEIYVLNKIFSFNLKH